MREKVMNATIAVLMISAILTGCKESDLDIDAPACIEHKIEELIKNEVSNPPTQIWKWEVDGNTYYYITSNCCDQYNYLYTENCEIVCAPDGGITGEGDGNCPIFTNEIIKTLIWEDQRS